MHIRTYTYSEGETQKAIKYSNEEITVNWKPELCKHSGRCVHGLSGVFNVNAHPWVNIDGASADEIKRPVEKCPTGALSYKLHVIGK
jgi:putative redox protein